MLPRIFIALILSLAATGLLFFGAAAMDGMCHCMKSMFTVFPYGTYVTMHFSSDTLGMPLTLIQFPAYALLVMVVKGVRWKLLIAFLIIVLHIAAATFALQDYCQSRRNCFLWREATLVLITPLGVQFLLPTELSAEALFRSAMSSRLGSI